MGVLKDAIVKKLTQEGGARYSLKTLRADIQQFGNDLKRLAKEDPTTVGYNHDGVFAEIVDAVLDEYGTDTFPVLVVYGTDDNQAHILTNVYLTYGLYVVDSKLDAPDLNSDLRAIKDTKNSVTIKKEGRATNDHGVIEHIAEAIRTAYVCDPTIFKNSVETPAPTVS